MTKLAAYVAQGDKRLKLFRDDIEKIPRRPGLDPGPRYLEPDANKRDPGSGAGVTWVGWEAGRDAELRALAAWQDAEAPVAVPYITGRGGKRKVFGRWFS